MRYWGSPNERSPRRPRRRKSFVASPATTKPPFLRKLYRHQWTISENLQRVIFFLMVSILLYAFVLGDGGVIRIASLHRERARLQGELQDLQLQAQMLSRHIERLKNDPFYIEKMGRERYGLIYPGELVIKMVLVPAGGDKSR